MKPLFFGLILASPAIAAWAYLDGEPAKQQVPLLQAARLSAQPLRIPVEVIAKGNAPKWVYVEVAPQAIPEPGLFSILTLTGVFVIFRRTRKMNQSEN